MNELKNRAHALLNSWTTCDVSTIAGDLAPQFQEIDRPEETAQGLDGLREKLERFHKVHSNVTLKVRKYITNENVVCIHWLIMATVRATETEPTPQSILIPGISWTYFENGKIVKNRIYRDIVGYLMQRGFKWTPIPGKTAITPEEAHA
jgi:hypothetical protein